MKLNLGSTFAAFRYRNYRLWFFGQLVSLIGSWVQRAALGYLVYTLTDSSAYLGYVSLASGLPSLFFMLYGGVIADRVARRTLILITQSSMMLLAFLLGGLVFAGMVQPWHILVISFLLGIAAAFEIPARQSLVVDLVEREDMTNAIALNVTMFNSAMIVGPAIAGAIYALAGPAWCFTINGISYLAAIASLFLMKIPPVQAPSQRPPALAAIQEGIQYAFSHAKIRSLTLSAFIYNIYDYAMITFIPVFAVKLLNGDAATNSLLLASNAAGAVLGGFILAAFAERIGRGKVWAVSAYITPAMIAAFAFSHSVLLSALLSVVIGVTSITVMSNTNTMIQSSVSDDLRGRVMSLFMLMFMSSGPLGSLVLGMVADHSDITVMLFVCTGIALIFAAWVRFMARPIVEIK